MGIVRCCRDYGFYGASKVKGEKGKMEKNELEKLINLDYSSA